MTAVGQKLPWLPITNYGSFTPTKSLAKRTSRPRVVPVMTWMMSNVTAKIDAMDNVYPRKEKPENKIDALVALIMALGTSMADQEPEPGGKESVPP